ncbi:nitroreductase [Nocardioides sp. LMS-CY]|uniref:4-nitrobenzoate reductase n=1 Tax=Nocardioides sp. (strain LMS-CY) TaxID=2840457 RepID=PNBA_NOCS0|nr:nitroreductase [Nocardioides sp. LMS-CY]UBT12490.1 PnbA [Nocardioides sp.]
MSSTAPEDVARPLLALPAIEAFDAIVRGRRSVRSYADVQVPRRTVRDVLELAARAPSNSNVQPWHTYVLTGRHKRALTDSVLRYYDTIGRTVREFDYQPGPDGWEEPYKERRESFGEGLYGRALGLSLADVDDREFYHRRNYDFFAAPVGLIVTVARNPRLSALIDAGAYIQTILLSARSRGLSTCAQASFLDFHPAVRECLAIPTHRTIVCGISLGYEDAQHPIASNATTREPVDRHVTFLWDDDD